MEPIAFEIFEESLVTNNTLVPTFLLLPLSLDCPERTFLVSNLLTSCVSFNESNIFDTSFVLEIDSISSETIIGNVSIPSILCPLASTRSFEPVAAIAATASKDRIELRGHKIEGIESFPIIVSDDIESINKTSEMIKVLDSLKLSQDIERLQTRKPRSGQSRLRGRSKKVGKSVLFVTKDTSNISKAIGSLPGVEVRKVTDLSILDLAPGAHPIRLTVYSKSAIEEIAKIKSTHLELMVKTQ